MSQTVPENRVDVKDILSKTKAEVGKVIVGYEDQVDDFLTCLLSDGHILMEGVPGVAKTTLSKTLAHVCGLSYKRIQFTQDLLPSDITGHYFYNQRTGEFELRKGPLFADFVLADEINRAPPKTQSALLEAMQERQVTIEGNTFPLPDPFMVIATLNPIETEGVYPLPEAQVDRFMLKSSMDYLEPARELEILKLKSRPENMAEALLDSMVIDDMKRDVRRVYVHNSILTYVRDLAFATRQIDDLELGLSPRGAIHLLQVAQVRAYLLSRGYTIPDDVKLMAHKVMDHRLILSPEADMEGMTRGGMTDKILKEVPVPKGEFKREPR